MLGDLSNYPLSNLSSSPARLASKGSSSKSKSRLASSSSSPSRTNSSSPFFPKTHLDAFHNASSPGPPSTKILSTPSKRDTATSSLPPSSPSFGLTTSSAVETQLETDSLRLDASTSVQDEPMSLYLERGTVLYFGRKAKKAIPRPRSPGFDPVECPLPVVLPKSAKNASRIHCSTRIVADQRAKTVGKVTIEVRVTGQNGMKIDGKLWKCGTVAKLTVEAGRQLEFSFWGWDAVVTVAESEVGKDTAQSRRASSPASSSLNSTLSEDEEEEEEVRSASKRRRHASPAFSTTSLSSPLANDDLSLPSTASTLAASRARELVSSLSLDLPGLLASTIVFHPRSTVGVDELVRALLKESGQGMWDVLGSDASEVERLKETSEGEERAVEAWIPVCRQVLGEERMFGMIDNTGLKDAAGRPLPPYYYYIPDLDPSPSRVEALEPFVKRVRGARTAKPVRYFWAKPSLKKNK